MDLMFLETCCKQLMCIISTLTRSNYFKSLNVTSSHHFGVDALSSLNDLAQWRLSFEHYILSSAKDNCRNQCPWEVFGGCHGSGYLPVKCKANVISIQGRQSYVLAQQLKFNYYLQCLFSRHEPFSVGRHFNKVYTHAFRVHTCFFYIYQLKFNYYLQCLRDMNLSVSAETSIKFTSTLFVYTLASSTSTGTLQCYSPIRFNQHVLPNAFNTKSKPSYIITKEIIWGRCRIITRRNPQSRWN